MVVWVNIVKHETQAILFDALKVEAEVLAVKVATQTQLIGFVFFLFDRLVVHYIYIRIYTYTYVRINFKNVVKQLTDSH